ncbi:hypothetical protein EIP86_010433 [Pleurotus ostreatoroseus]|nr:hypothetical protein EIP86_010433 [Pleurotus ostreatoroseus]
MSPIGAMMGTNWWNPGLEWNWRQRATGKSMYFTAAPDVIKQLLSNEHKTRLIKHEELMFPFLYVLS